MRGKIKELLFGLFNKGTVILPFSFRKISQQSNIASTEIAYQVLASKVPVFRRNKVTNSSASTAGNPFSSAAMKTLVFGNLFKLVRFAITFARVGRLPLGMMRKIRRLPYFSSRSLSPSGKLRFPSECHDKSKEGE